MANDATKYDADFEYVCEHVDAFFNRSGVQRALDILDEVGISGWEKWWQVEFAAWLSAEEAVGDWLMEERFLTDLRTGIGKNFVALDLGFRLKRFSTEEYLFLELKQNGDWRKCIQNMLADVDKVHCAQKRSENGFAIRNFFVVGIYPRDDISKQEVHDYIQDETDGTEIEMERRHIYTKVISGTPFFVTVF